MVKNKKTREIISDIAKKIKEEYKPQKIILYGSFAYGNPDRDSDIDLFIIKDTNERPIDRRVTIRRMVSKLRNGYPFSSIVLTPAELDRRLKIGDQFFQEIISKGEVLYAG